MRYTPNCNVYGEYNRALGKYTEFSKQIVLLMNKANKSVFDDKDVMPFDTQDRRWPIDFTLTSTDKDSETKAESEIMKYLPNAIAECALTARENNYERFKPFDTWFKQYKDGTINPSLISDEDADKCKKLLFIDNKPKCVIAPQGSSKVELVLMACREDCLANNYLFIDNDDFKLDEYKSTLLSIMEKWPDAILVFGNCNETAFSQILKFRKKQRSANKIIGLFDCASANLGALSEYNISPIEVSDMLVKTVNQKLDRMKVTDELVRAKISDFCEGNVQLMKNLDVSIGTITDSSTITSEFLTNQILKTEGGDLDRTIMRTLALFECVGWKDERREELVLVITNKDITLDSNDDSYLINKTIAIIKKGLKLGYLTSNGRTVSVTPKPLALQLTSEWFEEVDEQRLMNVIRAISENPHCRQLLQEFHDRFKYLGVSEEAVSMIGTLLQPGSVFENQNVLNTHEGSMLIECFAQVNPEAVVSLLTRALVTKTGEEILMLDGGRRYLVIALEKLCFSKDTFQQAATLMLRLANAENETISNNATGQFIGLFPVSLPSTEVDLASRLAFLQKHIQNQENKKVIMSALKRALTCRDFFRFGGAETMGAIKREPYGPKTKQEIGEYLEGCLKLVTSELDNQTEFEQIAVGIIEDTVISLCEFGYAKLILPLVLKIAKKRDFDWEKMQYNLSLFYQELKDDLTPEDKELYEDIKGKLTKNDPLSRFLRVEKELFYLDGSDRNIDDRFVKQQDIYKGLAKEFYDNNLLDKGTLRKLISSESIMTYPFGSTLAKLMNLDEQRAFIRNMIDVINECEKPNIEILYQFVAELSDEVFDELVPVLMQSKLSYTVFGCMGIRNIKPDMELFKKLHTMVASDKATVEDYLQYWIRLNINQRTDTDCISLFNDILSFNGGFPVVIRMCSFLIMNKSAKDHLDIAIMLQQSFMKYSDGPVIGVDLALNVAEVLLRLLECPDLAMRINEEVIGLARASVTSLAHNYELEVVYRLLMIKYFNVIWPSLSDALLSDDDDFMTYYNLKWFLGVDMADDGDPIICEGNHFEEMRSWLQANPEMAPLRLASIIKIADSDGNFTQEAMYLIDNYGSDKNLLSELSCSLNTFASIGSVIPIYERRKKVYSKLLTHSLEPVRIWAQSEVNTCEYNIAYEGKREREKI